MLPNENTFSSLGSSLCKSTEEISYLVSNLIHQVGRNYRFQFKGSPLLITRKLSCSFSSSPYISHKLTRLSKKLQGQHQENMLSSSVNKSTSSIPVEFQSLQPYTQMSRKLSSYIHDLTIQTSLLWDRIINRSPFFFNQTDTSIRL